MSQDTLSETAEDICRALMSDTRKVDCDIVESHIRDLLRTEPLRELISAVEAAHDDWCTSVCRILSAKHGGKT